MVLPFGKYKGVDIEELPDTYLFWLVEQDWVSPLIMAKVRAEAAERGFLDESEQCGEIALLKVAALYKEMAKKYHPDKGGSTEAMQAINDFYTQLKELS